MGYSKDELEKENYRLKHVIHGLSDDIKLKQCKVQQLSAQIDEYRSTVN